MLNVLLIVLNAMKEILSKVTLLVLALFRYQVSEAVFIEKAETKLPGSFAINDGFVLAFQTCSQGYILRNDDFFLSIENYASAHSYLKLSWSYNSTVAWKSFSLEPLFSIDSNIYTIIELVFNETGAVFSLRTTKLPSQDKSVFISSSYFNYMSTRKQLRLGSESFNGCIYSGRNLNISKDNYCPLENLAPCSGKVCPKGFTGRYCELNIDDCYASPDSCHSYSTCIDLIDGFKCQCGPQWTGRLCDQYLGSLCEPSPCKNNGICQLSYDRNSYSCVCQEGFAGQNCSFLYSPCSSYPCKNDGICFNSSSTIFNCTCLKGFTGIHCEININDCASGPCNQGQCIDGIASYICNCSDSGFYGSKCENDVNECNFNPCINGTCLNLWGTYKCNCAPGFKGWNCDISIKECKSNPCKNGASGFDIKDYDDDKCYQPCQNNCTCLNLTGNYECDCSAGYNETDSDSCLTVNCIYCGIKIDDCQPNPCHHFGTSIYGISSFNCTCISPYSGENCTMLHDLYAVKPCKNNASCLNSTILSSKGFLCEGNVHKYNCTCICGFSGQNCSEKNKSISFSGQKCGIPVNGLECQIFSGTICEQEIICIQQLNFISVMQNRTLHGSQSRDNHICVCKTGLIGESCSKVVNNCIVIVCVHNPTGVNSLTFNGVSSFASVNLASINITTVSFILRTRQSSGFIFGAYNRPDDFFAIGINSSNLTIIAQYKGGPLIQHIGEKIDSGVYIKVVLERTLSNKTVIFVGNTYATTSNITSEHDFFSPLWLELISNNTLVLGKLDQLNNRFLNPFKGCLSNITVGMVELSVYSNNTYEGCVGLDPCIDNPCVNDNCSDTLNDLHIKRSCNETLSNNCSFLCKNGNCVDGVNGSYCLCNTGYTGMFCEEDFNECKELRPCRNNGVCSDSHTAVNNSTIIVGFKCICTDQYRGKTCAEKLRGDNKMELIIGISIGVVVFIIIIIVIILLIRFFKDKSGMEGTYSPNREEQNAGHVEMNTLKKPNAERLI